MLFVKQKFIFREDLKNNPKLLYLFGDNTERVGFGGQAKEMRGEKNSFGIATKNKAAHGSKGCYFWDDNENDFRIVEKDFDTLERKLFLIEQNIWNGVVVPSDGIGTGLAKLSETAPHLLEYINNRLDKLEEKCYSFNRINN